MEMSKYVDDPVPTEERDNEVHSGKRRLDGKQRVGVVLALVLFVAFLVFSGAAVILHIKESTTGLETIKKLAAVTMVTPPTTTTKTATTTSTPGPSTVHIKESTTGLETIKKLATVTMVTPPPTTTTKTATTTSTPGPSTVHIKESTTGLETIKKLAAVTMVTPPTATTKTATTTSTPGPSTVHIKESTTGLETIKKLATVTMVTPPPTTTTKTATTTSTPGPSTVPPCPFKLQCGSHFKLAGTKCYYLSTNKEPWLTSKWVCESLAGNLVKIDSREEQFLLYGKCRALMSAPEDKFWIGLTDSEAEGVWKWTDGSSLNPSLTFWFKDEHDNAKEPDNLTRVNPKGEDCVRMGMKASNYQEKSWFDQDCKTPQNFICEKNPVCSREHFYG